MPGFTWYTPLWAAVEAVHAGRYADAAALRERALQQGRRAGDPNADLFAELLKFQEVILRGDWASLNLPLMQEKIATSPAGMAWRSSYAWMLAATGRPDAAREQLAIIAADDFAALPFDANWPPAMAEYAEACAALGDPQLAAPVYERLLPYADRTLTAGRAIASYGSTQRLLGGLAAALGRAEEAVTRHEDGIRRNQAAGFSVWGEHGRRALAHLRETTPDLHRAGALTTANERRDR
jgi:tetratricopeptide (TPR) repeat protein